MATVDTTHDTTSETEDTRVLEREPHVEAPRDRTPEREPHRRSTWVSKLGGVVVALLVLVGAFTLLGRMVSFPDLFPFDKQVSESSQPPLLKSIRNLSEFTAAEGNFEVVIDVENNRKYVPGFLLGERTLFVAAGSVTSSVDFSTIGKGAVKVDAEDAVTITLPKPVLGSPKLDLRRSYVFEQNRGVVNRLGDAFGSGSDSATADVYRLAEQKLAKAARNTELVKRAETNTTSTLRSLLGSLGYQDVTVAYTP